MTDVANFPGAIVRALVVEQLNPAQWHVVMQGADVPAGSLEGQASGVTSYAVAVADAARTADYTGLPILVAPYQEQPRPLVSPPSSRAFWHQRFRRAMDLDYIMYGRPMSGGAR